ncbi:xanthine phosphoribosyltransferase [Mesotoga sp.]|jgi:xanthine phosphoribosyltransferase|uniref:xanthine phosphoribosyltransferase n=1 Tax=Mesotoga sp. TaxID=2053577 RepID=UPI00345E38D9
MGEVILSRKEIFSSLEEAVKSRGSVMDNGILKVDSFLNHQIDPLLMKSAGELIADFFRGFGVTKVLTAESSGIAPALMAASSLGAQLVFARKRRPITMQRYLSESAPSHTKGGIVELNISMDYLGSEDRVIIVDDFLASGKTIEALARLSNKTGASLVGFAAIIEKTFEEGRSLLEKFGVPVLGIVRISSLDPLSFVENEI